MLTIDKISRTPIYEQIVEGIEREILLGFIKPSEQLPSIRELALTLSANPNTVQKAFLELDRRGIIISAPGRGCFVSEDAKNILMQRSKLKLEDIKRISKELFQAGITEEQIISAVKEAFNENNSN